MARPKPGKQPAAGANLKKASPAKAAKAGMTAKTNKKPSARGC